MKKIRGLAALMAFAVAAVPCFTLSAGAEQVKENISNDSSSVSYSWYWDIDPFLEAENMTMLYYHYPIEVNDKYNLDSMVNDEIVPFERNGKWGFVDYGGNELLSPKYDKIYQKGDRGLQGYDYNSQSGSFEYQKRLTYADGFITEEKIKTDVVGARTNRAYYWLDQSNQLASYTPLSATGVNYIDEKRTLTAQLAKLTYNDRGQLHEEMLEFSDKVVDEENPQIVLVNNGKRVNNVLYTDGGNYAEGLIALNLNGKWGYVNEQGKTVIPFEYDSTSELSYGYTPDQTRFVPFEASNGFISLCKNGKYSLVDTSGKSVISEGELEKILPVYEKDGKKLAWAKSGGKWGVIAINKYTSTPAVKYAAGDIDKDGSVTSADAIIVLRASIGFETTEGGDMDHDGTITSADALIVLRQSVGIW